MSDLTQALADGLFTVLFVFETFFILIDTIYFLDSGLTLLTLFYTVCLVLFLVNFILDFVTPDNERKPQEITDTVTSSIDIGI